MADKNAFKLKVAKKEIDLAKYWAEDFAPDLNLNVESFSKMLEFRTIDFTYDRLTICLSENKNIFGDHDMEIIIENGEISEVGLVG